jgi:hypothetical protein
MLFYVNLKIILFKLISSRVWRNLLTLKAEIGEKKRTHKLFTLYPCEIYPTNPKYLRVGHQHYVREFLLFESEKNIKFSRINRIYEQHAREYRKLTIQLIADSQTVKK